MLKSFNPFDYSSLTMTGRMTPAPQAHAMSFTRAFRTFGIPKVRVGLREGRSGLKVLKGDGAVQRFELLISHESGAFDPF